jgi:hypothetical protein
MLIKGCIERWDIPSVRYGTEKLFEKLYNFSEKDGFCELYTLYRDLFEYAYSQRRRILDSMIIVFNSILLRSWVPEHDVVKGEKASKMMLRLGIEFLDRDLTISERCLKAIDNLAGDMFEPEILSKEILFGAITFLKIKETKNEKLKDFVDEIADWIRINDQYAWEAGIQTYLRDSIEFAKYEQDKYKTDIETFKQKYLLIALQQNILKTIKDYVDFLVESEGEDEYISFSTGELVKTILAYEFAKPDIADEIQKRVIEEGNPSSKKIFKQIIQNNSFLRKIYEGSEMITTFDEFI